MDLLLAGLWIKGSKLQEGRGGKGKAMTSLLSLSQADRLRFGENPALSGREGVTI